MKIYKIECEWEMPIAQGYFSTKEKAESAIEQQDWTDMYGDGDSKECLKWIKRNGLVSVEEIILK